MYLDLPENLPRYTQIFEKFFLEVFFLFNFSPGILKIFSSIVRLFGNSTVSGKSGDFSGKFLYHLSLLPNFRKFSLNGKHPKKSLKNLTRPSFSSFLKWRYGTEHAMLNLQILSRFLGKKLLTYFSLINL